MIYLWTKMEYLVFWRGVRKLKKSHFPTIYFDSLLSVNYTLLLEMAIVRPQVLTDFWPEAIPYHVGLSMWLHTMCHLVSLSGQKIQERRRNSESKSKMQVTVFLWPNLRRDIPPLSLFFLFIRNGSSVHSRGGNYTATWIPAGRDHWGPS